MHLTRMQAFTLKEIEAFIKQNGYSPSVRELAERLDRSIGATHSHLVSLAEKKRIRLTGRAFGIEILR